MFKRIIVFIIITTFFVINNPLVVMAENICTIQIKILDIKNARMDLSNAQFYVGVGNNSVYCTMERKGGNVLKNGIGISIDRDLFEIKTSLDEDVSFLIFDDKGSYGYQISDTIDKSQIKPGEIVIITYKLSEQKKIDLKTSVDGDTTGSCTFYIHPVGIELSPATYETYPESRFESDDNCVKTIYLQEGEYDLYYFYKKDKSHIIYKLKNININTDKIIENNVSLEEFNEYKCSIPEIFNEYLYYKILYINGNDSIESWNTFSGKHDIKIYIQQETGTPQINISLSKVNWNIYSSSMSFLISLQNTVIGESLFPSDVSACKSYDDKIIINVMFSDMNYNSMRFIDLSGEKDLLLCIMDMNYNTVYTREFSCYWDYFNVVLPDGKYIASISPIMSKPGYDYISYFNLEISGENVPGFSYSYSLFKNENATSDNVVFIDNGATVKIGVKATFTDEQIKSFSIYKQDSINMPSDFMEKISAFPNEEKDIALDIEKEYLLENPGSILHIFKDEQHYITIPLGTVTFKDIKTHWAKEYIRELSIKNIVFGRDEETFYPNAYITRGEFAAFISNALLLQDTKAELRFTDVDTSDPLFSYIKKAAGNRLINGFPGGTFRSAQNILRQDAAVIMENALAIKNITLPSKNCINNFSDSSQNGTYAKDAINICVTNGIMFGRPGGILAPRAYITRAEATVLIQRLLKFIQ